jgi:uncharacterized membrane protein YsdA (DUF1294 family)/cold shock CspA family protein
VQAENNYRDNTGIDRNAMDPFLTAKIVEWNGRKGFGFLQVGKQRVFLHYREFAERHKRPAVGDLVRFTMGKDRKGRSCAIQAVHVNDGGRITLLNVLTLILLLVLPFLALRHLAVDYRWAAAVALALSASTYGAYALDKRRAKAGEWRLSEAGLHVLELLGGWPGAFLAQRKFRHKCSKGSYQVLFWLIVLGWQLAAFDAVQNWRWSRVAPQNLQQAGERRR